MLHEWSKGTDGTDGTGSTARVLMFDYKKAFDLIDHGILVNKLCQLDIVPSVINWIIDFLSDRYQRVKMSDGCVSEWGSVPSGVPQGTKLRSLTFLDYDRRFSDHQRLLTEICRRYDGLRSCEERSPQWGSKYHEPSNRVVEEKQTYTKHRQMQRAANWFLFRTNGFRASFNRW